MLYFSIGPMDLNVVHLGRLTKAEMKPWIAG
jgi:hypothetical protein